MEASSAASETAEVHALPGVTLERETAPRQVHRDYVAVITAWADILNARLLALLALLFGAAGWGYAIYDPLTWRFIAACGFSAGVVWPVFWLYARKA